MPKPLVMVALVTVVVLGCGGKNEPAAPVAKSESPAVARTGDTDKAVTTNQQAVPAGQSGSQTIGDATDTRGVFEKAADLLVEGDSHLNLKDLPFVDSLVKLAKTPGGAGDQMVDARKALVRLVPSLPQLMTSATVQFMSDVCRCPDSACATEAAEAMSNTVDSMTGLMTEIVSVFGKYDDILLGDALLMAARPALTLATPCSLRFSGDAAAEIPVVEPPALITVAGDYSTRICACETLACANALSSELVDKIVGKSKLGKALTEAESIGLTTASLTMSLCINKLAAAGK